MTSSDDFDVSSSYSGISIEKHLYKDGRLTFFEQFRPDVTLLRSRCDLGKRDRYINSGDQPIKEFKQRAVGRWSSAYVPYAHGLQETVR